MSNISDCGLRISDLELRTDGDAFLPQSAIRNPHSRGFTLIEVLLAMAILAAVVTLVYASFSTAEQNIRFAGNVRDETDLARTLMSRLCDDISNAYVRVAGYGIFFGKKEEVEIDGAKRRFDGISLTTLTNWRRPGTKETEFWEVGYRFQEKGDGNGRVLLRREKRELSKDVPILEGGVEYELTDRVANLQLRYYDEMRRAWVDNWDSRQSQALPRRVELTLTLAGGRVFVSEVNIDNAAR